MGIEGPFYDQWPPAGFAQFFPDPPTKPDASYLDESLLRGARRLGRSAGFSTLGATLVALDAGILSVPTTTAARIAWARLTNRIASGEYLEMKTLEIRESTDQRLPV